MTSQGRMTGMMGRNTDRDKEDPNRGDYGTTSTTRTGGQ